MPPFQHSVQTIAHDKLWPRDEEHRYRVYARKGDDLTVLFATPDAGGVGVGLITFHDDLKSVDRTLADEGRIGVFDTMPGGELSPKGEWIVKPWDRVAS